MEQGIDKFILVGDNLLNFHAGDPDYYEEWFEELEDGWVAAVNFRPHVLQEIRQYHLDSYLNFGGELDDMPWISWTPVQFYQKVSATLSRRLS